MSAGRSLDRGGERRIEQWVRGREAHPAGVGGLWRCRVSLWSGFHAVVAPSWTCPSMTVIIGAPDGA
jgi:hypothetical protein